MEEGTQDGEKGEGGWRRSGGEGKDGEKGEWRREGRRSEGEGKDAGRRGKGGEKGEGWREGERSEMKGGGRDKAKARNHLSLCI